MKKMIALLLLTCLLLTACDGDKPTESTENSSESTAQSTESSSLSPKELAESCIDKTVEELYVLIGEPESSDYAPSCNGEEGSQDGNLYYDGFTVYTLLSPDGETETVVWVE